MYGPEGNSWSCFPESLNVSQDEVEGNIRTLKENKTDCFPWDHTVSVYYLLKWKCRAASATHYHLQPDIFPTGPPAQ